ncbi:MAG: BON domain-containing protein [Gemmatimonadaceae bacterium]
MTRSSRIAMFAAVMSFGISLAACGPKDADLKTAADAALAGTPGVTVTVDKGVATISGQFANDAAKSAGETAVKAVKGISSVADNATVAPPPPPPAPVIISADDSLKMNVANALKDFSTVSADIKDGVVTLTGNIKKADLPKLMQAVNALHPKKVMNKTTITK